ncbi:SDR family NAD(P)-dependent oxidoreductase [Bradyrhizobium sp. CCGUVB23]|uniref:SDR family NAD(P)-dependent oxidoreductase n=1 Tax=Bradyrhizobium sp. CCGUVB23 TaxID=2949630 RepID=UPI0020B20A87|nr:SDR family oxidoreductase [Bradyrhizobium sp. CCGUVB23]MCP3465567.1 SDR family oxidoreductase [Bradyrhizobium sp. CCGUVB23]
MGRFDNKIVLITGAARGQGAEEARLLVAEGAQVVLADVREEEGSGLAASLGSRAVFQRLDVSDEASWQSAIDRCEKLGGLNGLVNNAGIYRPATIQETGAALMQAHFRVNQLGVFLGMKAAASLLKRCNGGSIVNISSTAGLQGIPNAIAYVGTKWAVRRMTKAAAIELASSDIRVNSVHPGLIDTEMLGARSREDLERRAGLIPLNRMGTAADVAHLVLFLLSDESAYMSGAEISMDGALSL